MRTSVSLAKRVSVLRPSSAIATADFARCVPSWKFCVSRMRPSRAAICERDVVARAHGDDAIGDHLFHRAAGILRRRAQHPQVDLDRFGHGPAVVDFDRDHVALVPGQHPRMHAGRLHVEQPLVHRQALARAVSGEHVGARARELEIDEAGASHVIGVALEERSRVFVDRLDVDPVDLKFQRARGRPDERSHPPVADGDAFLTARHGRVVNKVGSRDDGARRTETGTGTCEPGTWNPEPGTCSAMRSAAVASVKLLIALHSTLVSHCGSARRATS